ncbi:hypothetical protein CDL12_13968 [Handroanthus impetiginosus]|uniref:Uncharacterized protein n=1 Tax=Handroanthus impetiginosus TaxID=429701 RepID=A0A2G9H7X6_9LAMI|nr:hypothetical protein CDL12_13968 [Handroanthus impetiginosus]
MFMVTRGGVCGGRSSKSGAVKDHHKQLSLLELTLSALRKSMASTCGVGRHDEEVISTVHRMEIGWPTNVEHVTHVTFDRFHGFLGLPVELELEIPYKAPSASVSICGVSPDSMQWSYDTRGNSVPTILLLMQDKLYAQGGLKAEGIFRINPENDHEEHVREELSRGIVPEDIDVHCLAGLIKSWFRELPSCVLDGLSPERVLQCDKEEEFEELVKQLKPIESALLSWAIDLMADVVEQEESNKMNARNIAMVFAPNMTKMSDPLTALMHAVQVMNLLKTLIKKKLRERKEAAVGCSRVSDKHSDEEFDAQNETNTSCESREMPSEAEQAYNSQDTDEVESLSEVEGHFFLRQIDENEDAKDGFRKQLERILCRDLASPGISSKFRADSCVSLFDSKIGGSLVSTSDDD